MTTNWYIISLADGSRPIEVPRPEVLPEAGNILVVKEKFSTPGDRVYEVGDEIHLMARTWDAPFGKISSLGNWLAISKFGVSVWSNIEWAMFNDTIEVAP